MSQGDLGKVRVLVAENGQLRRQIKNVLSGHGFSQVSEATSAKAVQEAMELNLVDLLIADHDLDDNICAVVRDVRHFKLGANPFVVVVMFASGTSEPVIREIIDAGADDLLVKPITIGGLSDRVMSLTRARKKFVVTSDYIGPTRRFGGRPGGEDVPEIEVPNPVKDRATGTKGADMDAAVMEATRLINLRKLERDAFQVVWLTDRILPHYREDEPHQNVVELVDRLVMVSEEIGRRLKGTPFDHVGELCGTLQTVAAGIQSRPLAPPRRDLKLLPQLANAVKASLSGNADEVAVARDIASTVSGSS